MRRLLVLVLLAVSGLLAATVRLYLKDGTYHLVREYRVEGDRVSYYSTERSEWEQIPLDLVDLNRTEKENAERVEREKRLAAELSVEEAVERAAREERERVPVTPGVYLVEGSELRIIPQAESKIQTNKKRSVLKVLSPVPVFTGKSTVELDGETSKNVVSRERPEFYVRLSVDERFGIVRLKTKKNARIVQTWNVIPVSNELIEEQDDVEVFRQQLGEGLFKIWPVKPLEPGEYAIIEYTLGQGNIQVWDFAFRR
ncbi:MAG: hypothetical protein ACM3ZB_13535 [bacterium]